MFHTPNAIVRAARGALTMLGVAVIGVGIGPLGEAVRGVIRADPAIAAAAFLAVLLGMVALPWHRRVDILIAVVGIALLVCAIRAMLGRGDGLWEPMSAVAGATAAYAPVGIERLRRDARTRGDLSFEVIAVEDRRRRRPHRTGEPPLDTAAPIGG